MDEITISVNDGEPVAPGDVIYLGKVPTDALGAHLESALAENEVLYDLMEWLYHELDFCGGPSKECEDCVERWQQVKDLLEIDY